MNDEQTQDKPWYRYPWPWVAIAIPGAAVVMGITTLVLALNNPDPLVVDDETYRDLRSELKAQTSSGQEEPAPARDDGER